MHIHPWQIDPPSQLSIHALHTATANRADLEDISQCTYMHGRLTTPQSIEHTCLAYCYSKQGRSRRYITMHIYAWQAYPPVNQA